MDLIQEYYEKSYWARIDFLYAKLREMAPSRLNEPMNEPIFREGIERIISAYEKVVFHSRETATPFPVKYNGPYKTLGEMILDFRTQTEIGQSTLAKLMKCSIRTIFRCEKNEAGRYKFATPDRLLRIFTVPPEKVEEVRQMCTVRL